MQFWTKVVTIDDVMTMLRIYLLPFIVLLDLLLRQ